MIEELVKHGKDAIVIEKTLQTSQKTQDELQLSPGASVEMLLGQCASSLEDLLHELRLVVVGIQHGGGDEGNLAWLLRDPAAACKP